LGSRGTHSVSEVRASLDDLLDADNLLSTPATKRISDIQVARSTPDQRSTLLHELQHEIQTREGWARGGNTAMAPNDVRMAKNDALSPFWKDKYRFDELTPKAAELSQATYLRKLKELSVKPNLKPSQITNMAPWYEYSNDIRSVYGPMPNKAGPARDRWLNNAADRMYFREVQRTDLPEYRLKDYMNRDLGDLKKEYAKVDRAREKFVPGNRAWHETSKKFDDISKMSDYEQYRRLAGEAEARATQARMNMNMAQRREVFPLDSFDVPIDQLIVRGGLLNVGR
jgi:hypothetical protein